MTSKHIIDVSEVEFPHEVLSYSNQVPVVVDFWAEWCGPCHLLSPVLEKLATEANGAFRLAKVNVDENQNLAMNYNIQGIPAVKAFHNGQVVAEFTGAKPEPQVRDFLRTLTPSATDLNINKGNSLFQSGQVQEAATAFQIALQTNPDQEEALLGLTKTHLTQGNSSDALVILREFPPGKHYTAAEVLLPLAEAMAGFAIEGSTVDEEDHLAPAFERSLQLVGKGNVQAAADGLLDILQEDKNYRNGQAHRLFISMLEILGNENSQTREYRAKLTSLLF